MSILISGKLSVEVHSWEVFEYFVSPMGTFQTTEHTFSTAVWKAWVHVGVQT